jgi:hypothetical protein
MFFAQSLKLLAIVALLAGLAGGAHLWPQPQTTEYLLETSACVIAQGTDQLEGRTPRSCPTLLSEAAQQQQMMIAAGAGLSGLVVALLMWWMGSMLANQARLVELLEGTLRLQSARVDQTAPQPPLNVA